MNPYSLKCGAVLLAAGQGSRMGGVPKCLLTVDGVTLLERHLAAMSAAGIDRVVVVSGHYHQATEPVAARFPVTLVRNPDPDAGQPSSVKLGVAALGGDFDAVIVALADQPLVAGARVVYPSVGGERGNPVVLAGPLVQQLIDEGKAGAVRKFIDAHPAQVHVLDTDNRAFVTDLDTRDDVAAFEARTGCKLALPA